MSDFPLYILAFLVVLGVLITVHELGHYSVARLCGVKVLRFSLGFGKPLWQRRLGQDGTEWAVSALPLGGYVKMLDEREGAVPPEELHRAFNRQSVGKRSAIVAAGPAANFLLAILIYWVVFMQGSQELLPILGDPPADTPAAVAGLANGQQVHCMDGESVATWTEFRWSLLSKAVDQDNIELEVVDEQQRRTFHRLSVAPIREAGWEGVALAHLGITFFRPKVEARIGKVTAGSPGDQAGLRAGDLVLSIEGQPVAWWSQMVARVRASPGQTLAFTIDRQGEVLRLSVRPESAREKEGEVGRIGVAVAPSPALDREVRRLVQYGFMDAGMRALRETWDKSTFSLVMLGKMLTGEVSWKNLSGPVTIADYAGQSAKLGADYYLKFMAMVSISLGVLNLLPIPVLDGGYLLYHLIEVVRRRPLSERSMEMGQQIGISLLLALMAFAFFNDINRLLSG